MKHVRNFFVILACIFFCLDVGCWVLWTDLTEDVVLQMESEIDWCIAPRRVQGWIACESAQHIKIIRADSVTMCWGHKCSNLLNLNGEPRKITNENLLGQPVHEQPRFEENLEREGKRNAGAVEG